MKDVMSTTKEKEVIWEEKNSTEPLMNCESNGESDVCDITTITKDSNENEHLPDITETKVSGIYKIVNRVNGKYYVGSSKDIVEYRWPKHKKELRAKRHKNDYLQNAWNKYGENNFDVVIVEQVHQGILLEVEQHYLNIAKSEQDKCYNLKFKSEGGDISDYSRKKIGDARRGKITPTATRQKISEATKKSMNMPAMFLRMSLSRRDKTIYRFLNSLTNETFIGTRKEFCEKFKFHRAIPYSLVSGRRSQHKGWSLNVNNFTINKTL
jgi:hypothetical protein